MSKLQDFVKGLSGKPILIFGFGRSGKSAANAFKKAGAKIIIGDDSPDNLITAQKAGFDIIDNLDHDFSKYELLLLSPGIPLTYPKPHAVVEKAKIADIEIICDIEILSRIYPDMKTIGITGTNGKSTTTALLHHIINECGVNVQIGGNIGTPVFDLDMAYNDAWIVLEMSSFQIDLCSSFKPDISVILNLTPDHIDRHGSMENYAEVKERITELSGSSDYNIAVICSDDTYTQKIYDRAKGLDLRSIYEVSTLKKLPAGASVINNILYEDDAEIGDLSEISSLIGVHNHQNAACAYMVARKIGLEAAAVLKAMSSFPGLNHRQYLVRTINGVAYVNDSKATNAASSAVALEGRNNVYWIVGGKQKKTGLDGLEEFFSHIKHAFLIGESTDDFSVWMDKYGLEYTRCYNLENAVLKAHEMAQENRGQPGGAGIVLLSPACASFDQFNSFEDRGDKFSDLVKVLDE